jgi:hypothetical protein
MTAPAVAAKKTSQKSPRTRKVNGGLLRVGNPGNKGGGRPKSEVKAALRLSFEQRIPVLEQIADNPSEQAKDRIRAVVALGQHSDLPEPDQSDISQHPEARRFLAAVHMAITQECSAEVAERIRTRIEQMLVAPFGAVA